MSTDDLTTVRMRISDPDHPHYGESGYLTGEILRMKFTHESMAKLRLEHCQHGVDACYIAKGQIQRDELQPPRPRKRTT